MLTCSIGDRGAELVWSGVDISHVQGDEDWRTWVGCTMKKVLYGAALLAFHYGFCTV
jgi:GH25 family lysozyme M1 (1,4-beta-N-acetylmuramidase)